MYNIRTAVENILYEPRIRNWDRCLLCKRSRRVSHKALLQHMSKNHPTKLYWSGREITEFEEQSFLDTFISQLRMSFTDSSDGRVTMIPFCVPLDIFINFCCYCMQYDRGVITMGASVRFRILNYRDFVVIFRKLPEFYKLRRCIRINSKRPMIFNAKLVPKPAVVDTDRFSGFSRVTQNMVKITGRFSVTKGSFKTLVDLQTKFSEFLDEERHPSHVQ